MMEDGLATCPVCGQRQGKIEEKKVSVVKKIIAFVLLIISVGWIIWFSFICTNPLGDIYEIITVIVVWLVLFYPWLKLFISIICNRKREEYFGLFVATNSFTRVLSVFLTIINVVPVLFFIYSIVFPGSQEEVYDAAETKEEWDEFILISNIIGGYIVFWIIVHIVHGLYHFYVNKEIKEMAEYE